MDLKVFNFYKFKINMTIGSIKILIGSEKNWLFNINVNTRKTG